MVDAPAAPEGDGARRITLRSGAVYYVSPSDPAAFAARILADASEHEGPPLPDRASQTRAASARTRCGWASTTAEAQHEELLDWMICGIVRRAA